MHVGRGEAGVKRSWRGAEEGPKRGQRGARCRAVCGCVAVAVGPVRAGGWDGGQAGMRVGGVGVPGRRPGGGGSVETGKKGGGRRSRVERGAGVE